MTQAGGQASSADSFVAAYAYIMHLPARASIYDGSFGRRLVLISVLKFHTMRFPSWQRLAQSEDVSVNSETETRRCPISSLSLTYRMYCSSGSNFVRQELLHGISYPLFTKGPPCCFSRPNQMKERRTAVAFTCHPVGYFREVSGKYTITNSVAGKS